MVQRSPASYSGRWARMASAMFDSATLTSESASSALDHDAIGLLLRGSDTSEAIGMP